MMKMKMNTNMKIFLPGLRKIGVSRTQTTKSRRKSRKKSRKKSRRR